MYPKTTFVTERKNPGCNFFWCISCVLSQVITSEEKNHPLIRITASWWPFHFCRSLCLSSCRCLSLRPSLSLVCCQLSHASRNTTASHLPSPPPLVTPPSAAPLLSSGHVAASVSWHTSGASASLVRWRLRLTFSSTDEKHGIMQIDTQISNKCMEMFLHFFHD